MCPLWKEFWEERSHETTRCQLWPGFDGINSVIIIYTGSVFNQYVVHQWFIPEREIEPISSVTMMHSAEDLAGPMTRLTLQSKKPWEGTLVNNKAATLQLDPKLHARSSSSDSRRDRILRVRKNSDSEVSYFAPEEEEEVKKSNSEEADLRSSIGNSMMAHLLIHQSRHLTRSTLEKSPNRWAKPARSVVFDDFPHESVETKKDEGAEEKWTPVVKKKKLRDRRLSMNSDEGVRRDVDSRAQDMIIFDFFGQIMRVD